MVPLPYAWHLHYKGQLLPFSSPVKFSQRGSRERNVSRRPLGADVEVLALSYERDAAAEFTSWFNVATCLQ